MAYCEYIPLVRSVRRLRMVQLKYAKYKPHGAYIRLSNDNFILDADDKSGVIKGLYLKNDAQGTNFMGNEQNMRTNVWWKQRYVPEKSQRVPMNCWTGDFVLRAGHDAGNSGPPMHTFLSDDIRTVSYDHRSITIRYEGESANPGGLCGLHIEQSYTLDGDVIQWSICFQNTTSEALHIGELGIPIILNIKKQIGDEKQGFNHRSVDATKEVYEQRINDRYFVSGHSSYVLATRPSGKGDHVVFIPQGDTAIEAVGGDGLSPNSVMMNIEGPMFYLYSKATSIQPWHNGHRSLKLEGGERRTFSFAICRAESYKDIDEKLYMYGNVAVKVAPGMVIPKNATGRLLLRCRKPIHQLETSDGIEVKVLESQGDRRTYTVRLTSTGEQKVSVKYGDGEWTNLVFYGIEPLETLIKARASFIAENQQVKDPNDVCRYGFQQWDNDADKLLDGNNAPCGIIDLGGGDDRNFAPPKFLSAKNVYYPDQAEIKALDDFVEKHLYGKLQNPETYEVTNCLYDSHQAYEKLKGTEGFKTIKGFLITDENGNETTWRSWAVKWRIYNYPHVYIVYYCMYLITRLHGIQTSRKPIEYLQMAYRTALVSYMDSTYTSIYESKNYMDYHCGNMSKTHAPMGSPILKRILESMKEEGMDNERHELSDALKSCLPFFVQEEYPFATEYCFGHASHAAVYFLGQVADSESLKKTTIDAILARRDRSPAWYMYGVNYRMIGFYATPLMARSLLDRYEQTGDDYLLQMGYGGALVIWTCVEPTGEGYNTREWRFNPPSKGHPEYHYYKNGCMSGELGNGLQGYLDFIKSYLVYDPDFGVIGYGCEAAETENSYTVMPWDGVSARTLIVPAGIDIEVVKAKIAAVTVLKDTSRIEIVLRKPYTEADLAHISIQGLSAGKYRLTYGATAGAAADGESPAPDEIDVQAAQVHSFRVEYHGKDEIQITIERAM